jgi:hypothetical protein
MKFLILFSAMAVSAFAQKHPDFTGVWTNATITSLERPAALAGKTTLTEAEAKVMAKAENEELQKSDGATDSAIIRAAGSSGTGGYNVLFLDRGTDFARVDGVIRSSLVSDPPDGKVPPMTDDARKRNAALFRGFGNSDVKTHPVAERCILSFGSSSGPPMLPVLYNNNYQIIQTADTVMILVEMVHDVRLIRMNGTHPPADVKLWLGDSIGHWDGNTLVVDTTNFNPNNPFRGSGAGLHVVERFRLADPKTIVYKATMEDPGTWTKPWSVEFPFNAAPGPIYEYACHEGNYALNDILGGMKK